MFKDAKLSRPRDWILLRIFDESQDRAMGQQPVFLVAMLLLFALVSAIAMLCAGYLIITGNEVGADRAFLATVGSEMVISLTSFVARCPGIGMNHLLRAGLFTGVALL